MKGHNDGVASVTYDQFNRFIVSGSYDNSVKLWDSKTYEKLLDFYGHTDYVNAVCFGL